MFTLLLKEGLNQVCTKLYAKIKSNFAAKSHSHTKNQITDFPTSMPADGGNAETVNDHTVESNVPADAKFTDTTYSKATQSADGLMSAEDKKLLDELVAWKTKVENGESNVLVEN